MLRTTRYPGHPGFDRDYYSLTVGTRYQWNANQQFLALLQGERQYLGGQPWLQLTGGNLEWRINTPHNGMLSLSTQQLQSRYIPNAFTSNDTDVNGAGISYSQNMFGNRFRWNVALFGNHETALNYRADGSKNGLFASTGFNVMPAPGWQLNASISSDSSHYQRQNPVFLRSRRDQLLTREASLIKYWPHDISLTLDYSLLRNNSNLALYSYDRQQVALTLHLGLY